MGRYHEREAPLTFTHPLLTLLISPSTLVTVSWARSTTRILAGFVASCERRRGGEEEREREGIGEEWERERKRRTGKEGGRRERGREKRSGRGKRKEGAGEGRRKQKGRLLYQEEAARTRERDGEPVLT